MVDGVVVGGVVVGGGGGGGGGDGGGGVCLFLCLFVCLFALSDRFHGSADNFRPLPSRLLDGVQ